MTLCGTSSFETPPPVLLECVFALSSPSPLPIPRNGPRFIKKFTTICSVRSGRALFQRAAPALRARKQLFKRQQFACLQNLGDFSFVLFWRV
jgi:hypothetical protein